MEIERLRRRPWQHTLAVHAGDLAVIQLGEEEVSKVGQGMTYSTTQKIVKSMP
jgi:hypothetical protein